MNQLKLLWSHLHESFWFVPSLIIAFSMVLAFGLIEIDSSGSGDWMEDWPRLFGAGPEGARGMLATIAGSMITVVGVTFSMTLVTLALASSQYSSRILRTFMSDHATQVVLGIFAGIFTYCLIVLRTVRGGDGSGFVPSLSVAFSVVLAIGGIGTLIFFIHHIASSIQASSIIGSVARETLVAVDRLFPKKTAADSEGNAKEDPPPISLPVHGWQTVMAQRNGYLQTVNNATLLHLAREHQTIVRMDCRIGEFVVENTPLASLALDEPPNKAVISKLRQAYSIGRNRTVQQDCAFGIRQLVDVALRALSPGVNDTTTAVMCLDYLTAILCRLASREIPSIHCYEDGELRVILTGPTFASLAAKSFDEIRGSAGGNVVILVKILDALQTVAGITNNPSRRAVLREQAECIAELGERTIEAPRDRVRFEDRLAHLRESFKDEK